MPVVFTEPSGVENRHLAAQQGDLRIASSMRCQLAEETDLLGAERRQWPFSVDFKRGDQVVARKRLAGMFNEALFESVDVPVADCESCRLMMTAITFEEVAAAIETGND